MRLRRKSYCAVKTFNKYSVIFAFADKFIGSVMLCNSGNDLASAHSVIKLDFIKFFCFRNFFAFKDFCYAKFNFCKVIDCNFRLKFDNGFFLCFFCFKLCFVCSFKFFNKFFFIDSGEKRSCGTDFFTCFKSTEILDAFVRRNFDSKLLCNLIGGYKADRVWNVVPYVGVGWAGRKAMDHENFTNFTGTLSANYGILQTFRVAKRLSINLELAGAFFRNGFSGKPGNQGHDNMWSATAGITVDLGRVGWDNAPDVEALQGIYAGMIDGLQGQLDDALAANKEKQNQIKALEEANKALEAEAAALRNVKPLSVSESIFFEFGSSKIASKKETLNIKAYAEAAKAAGVAVKVVGFADVVGSSEYNVKLSQSRAEAVANVLKENGAQVESVVGYGESEEYKERFLNRRAVITVAE